MMKDNKEYSIFDKANLNHVLFNSYIGQVFYSLGKEFPEVQDYLNEEKESLEIYVEEFFTDLISKVKQARKEDSDNNEISIKVLDNNQEDNSKAKASNHIEHSIYRLFDYDVYLPFKNKQVGPKRKVI